MLSAMRYWAPVRRKASRLSCSSSSAAAIVAGQEHAEHEGLARPEDPVLAIIGLVQVEGQLLVRPKLLGVPFDHRQEADVVVRVGQQDPVAGRRSQVEPLLVGRPGGCEVVHPVGEATLGGECGDPDPTRHLAKGGQAGRPGSPGPRGSAPAPDTSARWRRPAAGPGPPRRSRASSRSRPGGSGRRDRGAACSPPGPGRASPPRPFRRSRRRPPRIVPRPASAPRHPRGAPDRTREAADGG